ncbi:MAG: Holliday junction resolvase RuvX [Acidobacteria bacterium]|nr:Holliday junction resolvase RuvX [Acidobacteriota bacterium]
MKTKILAIDWGTRRIGVAISDETKTLANPLPTLTVDSLKGVLYKIRKIIDSENVSVVVMGYPKNLNGTESSSSEKARKFGEKLLSPYKKKFKKKRLFFVDETLSSWQAKKILKELGENIDKENGRIDQIVAASILQGYLDRRKLILDKIAKRKILRQKQLQNNEKI